MVGLRPVRDRLCVPGSPIDLAVVRIVFFVVALPAGLSRVPSQMAGLPAELRDTPVGAGFLYWLVGPDPDLARAGGVVMVAAALAALFGFRARWAALVWAVTAAWVMGIPNLFGKVNHEHHLLWFAVLLAASPCADALSVDALRRGRSLPEDHVRYGLPIRLWWLILGGIYFFAGLWKLGLQGLSWASPSNMRALLYGTWAVTDDFNPIRVDRWPVLLAVMGVATIVFELGFVFVAFSRHRWIAPVAGLAFHLSTFAILDISFVDLMACYAAFVPWAAATGLVGARAVRSPARASPDRPDHSTVWVGTALLIGMLGFGFTATVDGWPFANYPTFAERFSPTRTVLEFEVELDDGSARTATLDEVFAWVPASRRTRIAAQFLALDSEDQASVLHDIELPDALESARRIEVFQVAYRTDPDHPGIESRRMVGEVALPEPDP